MKQFDKDKLINLLRRMSFEIRIRESQNVISSIFNDTQKQETFTGYKELSRYDIKELQMLSHVDYWNRTVNDYCLSEWFIYFADETIINKGVNKHMQKLTLPISPNLDIKVFDVIKLLCSPVCVN